MQYRFTWHFTAVFFWQVAVVLGLLAATVPARSGNQVAKGPAESWVEFIDIPKADPARANQIRNGISYLLYEYQAKHRDNDRSTFSRDVYTIIDRPGLETGATINIEFDPSRHEVTLNRLHIIREGKVLDRLADVKFDIFRRETDAEKGIFDGRLTAHINLEDVRVGDTIDYATTYEITPLIGKDLIASRFDVEWGEPVGLIRQKVIWPSTMPLTIKALRTEVKPSIVTSGADTVYLWEVRNPPPVRTEENLPAGYPGRAAIEISSAAGWKDIVDAVAAHYQPATSFPAEFAAKLDRIAARYPERGQRLVEAMRLVQDEIRYVSLSIGAGTHVPRRPETVVTSGFGDCKDKSLLLVSALRQLGIEADVALTDIDDGKSLDQVLPSLGSFDHAIVRARIADKIYWLDATDYLQGGRAETLVAPDYGFALPLTASGASLERIGSKALMEPTADVFERFSFPKGDDDPLLLSVSTTYKGAEADRMRRKLANEPLSRIGDDYVDYYNRRYPGIKSTAALDAKDDRDANILSVKESYELPAAALRANDLAKDFPLKAVLDTSDLPTPTAVNRTGPIALGAPVYKRHTVTVSNLGTKFIGPENANVKTPYLDLQVSSHSSSNVLEIEWNFKTLKTEVPASAAADYLQSIDDLGGNVAWSYNFTIVEPGNATSPAFDPTTIAGITFFLSLLVVLGIIIHEASRSIAPSDEQYLPISMGKFVVMSLVTSGLYACLWAWRAFWRQKATHGANIWPFWRALFLPIWLIPAFLDVNRKLAAKRLPQWLGIGAALAYFAFWAGDLFAAFILDFEELPIWWSVVDIVLMSMAPIPLVLAVSRLNEDAPEYRIKNSRFTRWDVLGIMFGVVFTSSLLYLQLDSAPTS